MSDPAAVTSHSAFIATDGTTLPGRSRDEFQPTWTPPEKRLSKKDTFTAGAFMAFYLAAYLAAGYAGVTFIEWAWMRVFG